MTRAKNDEGTYRVTCVGETGATTTRKFTSRSKARQTWVAWERLPHVRYAVFIELDEDGYTIAICDEWAALAREPKG